MKELLTVSHLTLSFPRPLAAMEAALARGNLGRRFPDKVLIHNHDGKRFIYTYPRVQVKVTDGKLVIIGIEEGYEIVCRLAGLADLKFKNETLLVNRSELRRESVPFGVEKSPVFYSFNSPWLALNEQNVVRYQNFQTNDEKQVLLSRILIGNILSMAKGLERVVTQELTATLSVEKCSAYLKGVQLVAFKGNFAVNFQIPDYFGLGKSVSRGFGTVVKK